jgi:hypothetical protein
MKSYPSALNLKCVPHKISFMDDKYQISKSKKPETKQEVIQHQIEELIKRRDKESDLKAKQAINAEITKLFAQYQRLNL